MKQRPTNIILITIDNLRADHLGCYGYPRDSSPNLDYLAGEGVLFEQAISTGNYTPLAFPSILASVPPPLYQEQYRNYLETKTLVAQVLKENGCFTAAFLAANPFISRFYHYDKGFDIFDDGFTSNKGPSAITRLKTVIKGLAKPDSKRREFLIRAYHLLLSIRRRPPQLTAEEINKKAFSFLKGCSQNFFLWLHYMDVHPPFVPPAAFLKPFCSQSVTTLGMLDLAHRRFTNPDALSSEEVALYINLYDASIKYVDNAVGKLIDELRKLKMENDTVLIITADHGEELGEHKKFGQYVLYEGAIHVPLIIYLPRHQEGITVRQQVSHLDLAPTILDLQGIDKVGSFQGKTLLPLIRGKAVSTEDIISISIDHTSGERAFSCRSGSWKFIMNENGGEELYNLQSDPAETMNLLDSEREKGGELKSKILEDISHIQGEKEQLIKVKIKEKVKKLKGSGRI